ncbi:MAG: type I-U CRISPR-associated RAMP protein Csb1/Cas7u [Coriobacteriales bacterium]|nr:type I-U CRISPR-associated RAMP protein Csb1/Cas7u [Coriobacteriales bacterium]
MAALNIDVLMEASRAGGAGALSSVTELAPAGGEQALVAPAKYASGSRGTYVFETREIDGEPMKTVLLDSRSSMANRVEDGIRQGIKDGNEILCAMPKIRVTYKSADGQSNVVETDLDLPHRAFDGHIRLGFDEHGKSIAENPTYIAARNSTLDDMSALLAISPITCVLGGWDSSRKSHQVRLAASVTGEIIGVLSDQDADPESLVTKRSGARVDPVGAGIYFDPNTAAAISKRIGKAFNKKDMKNGKVSGSSFVIGAIPPGVEALDGISTSRIIRTRVLSFATLRSICFAKDSEGDAAIRSLLAAIAIDGMVRADSELLLRANAHLVEKDAPKTLLHERYGKTVAIDPMSVEQADKLLKDAYENAHALAGISWDGQTLEVVGEPAVIASVDDTVEE